MKIRLKTFIIIAVSTICIVLLMTFTVRLLLMKNFLYEEDKLLNQNFKSLVTMLKREQSTIANTAMDWSKWDDTYQFVKDGNQKYISDNLHDNTFLHLKLNVMIFSDHKGKIIYSKGYDLDEDREAPIDAELIDQIKMGKLLHYHTSVNDIDCGMLIVSGKPMIIASSSITSSDKKSPVNGNLIIGRYIDRNYIQYLQDNTQQCIMITGLNNANKENLVKNKVQNQNPEISDMAVKKDNNTITGYALIKDINGTPSIVITAGTKRDIYSQGMENLYLFIFIFIIGLFFIILVCIIVLDMTVVRRLKILHGFLEETGKNKDISARIKFKGKDEIAGLAFSVNRMLNEIEKAYKDINNIKRIESILRESVRNYRKIVNLSPDAMAITVDGIIVLANKLALKYFDKPIGENIENLITPDFTGIMRKRIKQIVENKIKKTTFDYQLILKDNSLIDVEIASSYFSYKGKPAIISSIRDISKRKKDLNSAANFQKQVLKKEFPIPDKAKMQTLYMPAKTVSGDFYFFHKVDESLVIGILGDVSGKGITAALSISAFNVLFKEEALICHNPSEILHSLNQKVADYLGERYIAACSFSIDFNKNEIKMVGAGINQFIYQSSFGKYHKKEIKGPFLGMFGDSAFDEEVIQFQPGDKFYFFTDGLDFIFFEGDIHENFVKTATTTEFINYLNSTLEDMLTDVEGIKDDCTLLALEIK